jgi:Amt family ammonium transporter
MSWMFLDWFMKGKPSAVGIAIGAVCGLVAITPASGYVGVWASIVIGLVAGIISNLVANLRARTRLDDSLDVFACHGVSGIWGALATGLFATLTVNSAGANGWFYGNPHQFVVQLAAVATVAAYSFVGSYIILWVLKLVMGLRVTHEEEMHGLDVSQHGESAYTE